MDIFRAGRAKKSDVIRDKWVKFRASAEEVAKIKRFAKFLQTDISTVIRISLQIAMRETGFVRVFGDDL